MLYIVCKEFMSIIIWVIGLKTVSASYTFPNIFIFIHF